MDVFETACEEETAAIAARIANAAKRGDVFLLDGNLGAGKSVFARAFIRSLCGAETEVPSPTFTLVQTYDFPKGMIWHFDLYRLQHPEEVFELGWEEALSEGVAIIEWPVRAGPYLPKSATHINIETLQGNRRKVTIDEQ